MDSTLCASVVLPRPLRLPKSGGLAGIDSALTFQYALDSRYPLAELSNLRYDHFHAGFQTVHAGVQAVHAGFQAVHAGIQAVHAGIQLAAKRSNLSQHESAQADDYGEESDAHGEDADQFWCHGAPPAG